MRAVNVFLFALVGLCVSMGFRLSLSWCTSIQSTMLLLPRFRASSEPDAATITAEERGREIGGPPFHDWSKAKSWLCPGRIPNLTAAAATFQLAQQIGLTKKIQAIGSASSDLGSPSLPPSDAIETFFSFWPGHVSLREKETNRTATFLRTYKCGSMTVVTYFLRQIGFLGRVSTSLHWANFTGFAPNEDFSCICTVFRDPMERFFSGLGEIELRRQRALKKAAYERMDILSHDRVIAFVEFLLRGDWYRSVRYPLNHILGHVLPQSGYFVRLNQMNKTISGFVGMENLAESIPHVLADNCGLPEEILPPVNKNFLHRKIKGLSAVHKTFWADGSAEELAGKEQLPALQALCLLNAVDYACLDSELKVPPPEVCADVFEKFL